ncbi:hypothetical protein ACFGD2_012160 [Citrobacter freundii]
MTTNNHPAHGPVSLDRLHQIRETLSKAAAQSDGGNIGYAMSDAVKVIDGAIAAFGTEPVAYMTYKGYLLHAADPKLAEYSDPTPLYTAPPAPVSVPAAMEMDDDFDSAFEHGKAVGWNACRAAMIQAGNFRENQNPSTNNCREISETSTNEHVRHEYRASDEQVVMREYRTNHSVWIQCSKQAYERRKAQGYEVRELYERHQAGNSPAKCSLREGIEAIRNSGIPVDVDRIQSECAAGNSPATPDCWCRTCRPVTMSDMRFVVCPDCGNKRCPHANDHRNACTGSNEPGQIGSAYPAAPQQEVKLALEHGMQRYASVMQKLSEGD